MPVKKEVTEAKYDLIVWLIEKEKFSIEQITNMTPQEMTAHTSTMDEPTAQSLKTYINDCAAEIKKYNLMFPSRRGGKVKSNSILYGLRKYLIKHGRTLADIGLKSKMEKENDKAINADSKSGIIADFTRLFS